MPPKFKFKKEEIIESAANLVRESGVQALTARNLALRLGTSAKPIFGQFQGMDELKEDVLKYASTLYEAYLAKDMAEGKYPPYKASGMAYIRFAREEKELFKLLFMRDRSGEKYGEDRESIRPILEIIKKNLSLDEESAYLFHLELWIYVHGIAAMIATSYLNWDEEFTSRALSDVYLGLKHRYTGE